MEDLVICELCKRDPATDSHHLMSQSKKYKELYPDFIHDRRNLMYLCKRCHLNRTIPKYSEKKFCEIMGIAPRSKTEKFKEQRELF